MYSFLIQTTQSGYMTGHQLFHTKAEAVKSFNNSHCMDNQEVSLIQGAFKLEGIYCHSFGMTYILASN